MAGTTKNGHLYPSTRACQEKYMTQIQHTLKNTRLMLRDFSICAKDNAHKRGCDCHHAADQHFVTTLKILWFRWSATCTDTHLRDSSGNERCRRSCRSKSGDKKYSVVNATTYRGRCKLSLSIFVDDIKTTKKNGNWGTMWKHSSETIVS